jgi:hypothetical protein
MTDMDDDGPPPDSGAEPLGGDDGSGGRLPPGTLLDDNSFDDRHHEEGGGRNEGTEDGRFQRPDGPSGAQGNTPAARLDALVEAAMALAAPKLHDVERLIAQGEAQHLTPGAMGYLKQVIFEKTGVAMCVLNQVHKDCRNTDAEHGVLHSVSLLAESAMAKLRMRYVHVVASEGCFWHYAVDGEENPSVAGYYERSEMRDVENFLLQEYSKLPSLESKSRWVEVTRRMTGEVSDPAFFDDAPNGMNLRNGFLTLDAAEGVLKLLPAGPEHKARSRLMVEYDPAAQAPIFLAGLARTFSNAESIAAFGEFVGCALLGVTPGHDDSRHVLMLVGPRKGGKSTLLELQRELVPSYAICSVSPTSWGRDYDRGTCQRL